MIYHGSTPKTMSKPLRPWNKPFFFSFLTEPRILVKFLLFLIGCWDSDFKRIAICKSITIESLCTCDPATLISLFKCFYCCRKGAIASSGSSFRLGLISNFALLCAQTDPSPVVHLLKFGQFDLPVKGNCVVLELSFQLYFVFHRSHQLWRVIQLQSTTKEKPKSKNSASVGSIIFVLEQFHVTETNLNGFLLVLKTHFSFTQT